MSAHVVQKEKLLPATSKIADRRIQRTRRALRDALLSLLQERGWDDLSVQDICERADVGRSTFYVHFQNKEELLAGSLNDLRRVLSEQAAGTGDGKAVGALTFVRGLIEHIHDQRRLCRSIFGRRSGHVVQMRFREMVTKLVAEDLSQLASAGWRRDAATHYIAGALVELLAWWVDAKNPRSAEEIDHYFLQLARPAITELTEDG